MAVNLFKHFLFPKKGSSLDQLRGSGAHLMSGLAKRRTRAITKP